MLGWQEGIWLLENLFALFVFLVFIFWYLWKCSFSTLVITMGRIWLCQIQHTEVCQLRLFTHHFRDPCYVPGTLEFRGGTWTTANFSVVSEVGQWQWGWKGENCLERWDVGNWLCELEVGAKVSVGKSHRYTGVCETNVLQLELFDPSACYIVI